MCGITNPPQAPKSCAATLSCNTALCSSRAPDRRPSPWLQGHSLPRELPGRGESHGPGRAETFWCRGRSLQIQLEQLKEGDARWQRLKVSPETPAQAVAALSAWSKQLLKPLQPDVQGHALGDAEDSSCSESTALFNEWCLWGSSSLL